MSGLPSSVQVPAYAEHRMALSRARALTMLRYLACVLVIPALLWPVPFAIVRLPSYEHWSTSSYGAALEYGFDEHPKDADVVVFGDSSAFLGIDPRIVSATLGLKTVVLPGTVGSIPVTGDKSLQSYLEHNRPPRLIVFYFSAWNLDFTRMAKGRYFEGEEMMLRHMTWREIAHFARKHPTEVLEFPFRLYSTFGPKLLQAKLHHVDRERAIGEALGHMDYKEPFPPLREPCSIPAEYMNRSADDSVQDLVRRYKQLGLDVMGYLAPVPQCRNSAALQQKSFARLAALPPGTLPAMDFAADDYYAHIEPVAVPASSALFAEAVSRQLSMSSQAAAQTKLQ
jgi:hypothetical protein